jgi:hypothetical protein
VPASLRKHAVHHAGLAPAAGVPDVHHPGVPAQLLHPHPVLAGILARPPRQLVPHAHLHRLSHHAGHAHDGGAHRIPRPGKGGGWGKEKDELR